MASAPKITVLMPVYNGEKFLHKAVESILSQTFEDFEFLIINDASTDNSRDIILSYCDPRIRLIENKRNMGLTFSLNKGLKLAHGEFVARIDADDVSLPQRLEKQLRYITEYTDVGMVSCWYDVIDENGGRISTAKSVFTYEDIYYNLTFYNCLGHSTVLFNKKLVLSLGGYDETYKKAEDYALWYKLSRVSRIEILTEVLVKMRKHSSNISYVFKDEQDHYAYELFRNNVKNLLPEKINERYLQCLHDYNYLNQIDEKTVKKTIITLYEINQRLIASTTPSLNLNPRKIEKSAFDKAWIYLAFLIKKNNFLDFFIILSQYPKKKDFLTFMPSKIINKLRNILYIS